MGIGRDVLLLLLLVLPVGGRPAGAAAAASLRLELLETSFSDLRDTPSAVAGGLRAMRAHLLEL